MYIHKYGDPILTKKTEDVTEFGDNIAAILDEMLEAMYEFGGVGLAANQVGISKRMLVADTQTEENRTILKLVNPYIISHSKEKQTYEEGCLSFPGITEKIDRYLSVKVSARDYSGKKLEIDAEGFLAVILQHEIDHLDGVTFVDRMSPARKLMHIKELNELKSETKKNLKRLK